MDRLVMISELLTEVIPFVDEVYFIDVCAIAAMYAEWFNYRQRASTTTSPSPIFRSTAEHQFL